MIDRHLLVHQKRLFGPAAKRLVGHGVSANMITLLGLFLAIVAFAFLARGDFAFALLFIVLNRAADGLDGVMARLEGPTDRGAFLDVAFDFVFYGSVPLGFAIADPQANALAATVLLFTFIGTGSSFLAFAVIAARRGLESSAFPQKGIYYIGGLTESAETLAAFVLMCLLPHSFAPIAYAFAALAAITTMLRYWWAWTVFAERKK